MMKKECRTMKIDYQKRCIAANSKHGVECDVMLYGVTAEEVGGILARDLPTTYADLSVGGRRPGRPVELEKSRHFFNRRIE